MYSFRIAFALSFFVLVYNVAFYLSLLSKHVMELHSGEGAIDNTKIVQDEKKIDLGEKYPRFLLHLRMLSNISEASDYDATEHYEDDPAGDDSFTDTPISIDNGN